MGWREYSWIFAVTYEANLFCFSLLLTFVMPIALQNITWKTYIINGSWDVITFFLIVSTFFTVSRKSEYNADLASITIG